MSIAVVANGDPLSLGTASGVALGVIRALQLRTDIHQVHAVNAKPPRWARLVARVRAFRPSRRQWWWQHVYGPRMTLLRSLGRDRALDALPQAPDMVLHVRGWYLPARHAYTAFIDATGEQLAGTAPVWDYPGPVRQSRYETEREFYQKAIAVYATSHETRDALVARYDVDPSRVLLVGNGANVTGPGELPPSDIDAAFDLGSVLFIGREPFRKGFDVLLDAMRIVTAQLAHARLVVVGLEDVDARSAGLRDSDTFVDMRGAITNTEELAECYRSASLVCVPSRQEAFGLAATEAMSFGRPLVVSDTGELPLLAASGERGAVVPVGDAPQLAGAIASLLTDRARYRGAAMSAFSGRDQYTWAAVVDRIVRDLRTRVEVA